MQCGSNLSATFLAFDGGGGLVCVPRSGAGASGGVGAAGAARDELSCGEAVAPDSAVAPAASTRPNRKMSRVRGIRTRPIVLRRRTQPPMEAGNWLYPPTLPCRINELRQRSSQASSKQRAYTYIIVNNRVKPCSAASYCLNNAVSEQSLAKWHK
jgi:hypothetical protein